MRKASLEARWRRLAASAGAVVLRILVLVLAVVTMIEAAVQIRNFLDGIIRTDRPLLIGGHIAAAIPAACTIYWGGRAIFAQRRSLTRRREDPA